MYRAKNDPNAAFCVFDESMRESVLAQHRLENDLRRAVERDEFVIHYQPIVSVDDGQVRGFEALLRWHHPELGMLQPERFLPVAEETGLIVPVGWRVLEEAVEQAARWQALFPVEPALSMSVNVSGKFFTQSDALSRFADLLDGHPLVPGSLHLEITESVALDHGLEVLATLDGLRGLGVQLNIDDFGTGYASLTYLQRFSYDTLKIDRSFVRSMVERDESAAIVKAILALGRSLGMRVIAEGVETSEQLDRLRSLHCEQAQGFWFSHPLDPRAIVDRLTRSSAPLGWA